MKSHQDAIVRKIPQATNGMWRLVLLQGTVHNKKHEEGLSISREEFHLPYHSSTFATKKKHTLESWIVRSRRKEPLYQLRSFTLH